MKSLLNKAKPVRSFQIEEFKTPCSLEDKNYVNKLQTCCIRKSLAIATEKGNVYIYNVSKNEINKCVYTEPWVSSIENCRGNIWASGISRSLMCIRVKDNKKIFHTNIGTKMQGYIDKGLQILQEKVVRYFFYNSENSNMRIMHSFPKKIILRPNLIKNQFLNWEQFKNHRLDQFKVDNRKGHIIFTFRDSNILFVYSYYQRKIIQQIEVYSPVIQQFSDDINLQFSCGNDDSSGLIATIVSFLNVNKKRVNIFSMYEFDFEKSHFIKRYSEILHNIRGEPERILFFRNFPPNDVIVVPDDEGYIYIYKVSNLEIKFFDMIKDTSNCSDIVTARGYIFLASSDGKINMFSLRDDNKTED